jgi:uncharacterized lipoprotein YajG
MRQALLLVAALFILAGCGDQQGQSVSLTPFTARPTALAEFNAAAKAGKPIFLEFGAPW